MLKRFTFRNCYSFRDETVLSMEAVYAMKDNWGFVVDLGGESHRNCILPVAAIFGANAGGKSNVICALRDAAKNVCERTGWILNSPFSLTDEMNDEFEHNLNLLIGEYEFTYSYTANEREVIRESLKRSPIGHKDSKLVFSREGKTVKNPDALLDKTYFGAIEKAAQNTEYLIVNSVATLGIPGCSEIYRWCRSVLAVTLIKSEKERWEHLDAFAGELAGNVTLRNRLSEFIKRFDPAITSVRPFDIRGEESGKSKYILGIGHNFRNPNGSTGVKFFPAPRESNGTQKILELYPMLADALDNGKPLVIDELDTMFHPLVFKKIVALFNDKSTNPNKAQLIFASHNTEVMNREELRRDEIHIVEKNDDGVSSIFRLSDCVDEHGRKVRMDARYDRVYLEGLLGSIPSNFEDVIV